ncbi:hypothetical protein B0H63DRAFT_42130 [Podospora didyma]|uniref:Extracellular membrane protein CFEM domain-containing protein n=1 Tax=Podospora didyma TaxID=330526 RepID=A0AAE0P6M1_9PEZI|nr:hypothetical protein B0H63DRAFT_42130 [Podospora didyma]
MKTTLPILALAASVAATGFHQAKPFTCPSNTDNTCTDAQKPGFNFEDLIIGGFTKYKDFNFKGFSCGSGSGKRFAPRTNGGNYIHGTCGSKKETSPSFGCGSGSAVDKFSLGSIHVKPEFDCDLEFHYDMPDGSTCKHRNSCKKSGTTVTNTQCGGAKNVTIIFPPQPNKPKPSCSIEVPTVSFDCSTASSTKSIKTTTSKAASSTTTAAVKTTTSEVKSSSTPAQASSTAPATSSKPAESSTAPAITSSKPAESSTAPAITSSKPAESSAVVVSSTTLAASSTAPGVSSSTPAAESSTAPGVSSAVSSVAVVSSAASSAVSSAVSVASSTAPGVTSSAPGVISSTVAPVSSSPAAASSSITTTIVTSFQSTSTIFTTLTSTLVSCAPTVPNCPANSITVTVVTVVVGTTLCPVTETRTTVLPPVAASSTPGAISSVPGSPAASSVPGAISSAPGSPAISATQSAVVSSAAPVETLPCPDVVPSCLNTFLFSVGCKDNSDSACYCPDSVFVKSIFNCIYAHGASDQIVSEAVLFFQGICAPFVSSNPGIVDATVTTYITATATPTAVAPVYTTITVDVTTVVPCTDSAGVEIPSSSTTSVISTTLQVPQVGFQTGTAGSVGVIPVTAQPIVDGGVSATATATGTTVAAPIGTGSLRPKPTQSGLVTVNSSGRVNAGLSLAAAMALLAAVGI